MKQDCSITLVRKKDEQENELGNIPLECATKKFVDRVTKYDTKLTHIFVHVLDNRLQVYCTRFGRVIDQFTALKKDVLVRPDVAAKPRNMPITECMDLTNFLPTFIEQYLNPREYFLVVIAYRNNRKYNMSAVDYNGESKITEGLLEKEIFTPQFVNEINNTVPKIYTYE